MVDIRDSEAEASRASGGMKKRVGLARSIAIEPEVSSTMSPQQVSTRSTSAESTD